MMTMGTFTFYLHVSYVKLQQSQQVFINTHRLFKRAACQCTRLLSVDTVSSDRHQMTLGRHDVTQQRQMAVVHVRTVE